MEKINKKKCPHLLDTYREKNYPEYILTDDLEFYIIELSKYEKYKGKMQNNPWIDFINNPEVENMEDKNVEEAKKELEKISQDEKEIYIAELREKYIMDQKAIEDAGYYKGLEKGENLRSRKREKNSV